MCGPLTILVLGINPNRKQKCRLSDFHYRLGRNYRLLFTKIQAREHCLPRT
nr:MAG TPA: hypothetical protein [Caudoviricetes sp.]